MQSSIHPSNQRGKKYCSNGGSIDFKWLLCCGTDADGRWRQRHIAATSVTTGYDNVENAEEIWRTKQSISIAILPIHNFYLGRYALFPHQNPKSWFQAGWMIPAICKNLLPPDVPFVIAAFWIAHWIDVKKACVFVDLRNSTTFVIFFHVLRLN